VDPLSSKYPELTPYQFASNRPLDGIDEDGLEWMWSNNSKDYVWKGFQANGTPYPGSVSSASNKVGNDSYHYSSDVEKRTGTINITHENGTTDAITIYNDKLANYSHRNKSNPNSNKLSEALGLGDGSFDGWRRTNIYTGFTNYNGKSGKDIFEFIYGYNISLDAQPGTVNPVYPEALLVPLPPVLKMVGIGRVGAVGGELGADVAETFRFGRYSKVTLDEPIVLSRYYDNINAFSRGRFFVKSTANKLFDRLRYGIRPSWNKMTKIADWEVPAGTTIYKGRSAMQFPWVGGGTQYFIPDISNLRRIIK
jgi:hypothetical protein